MSEVSMSEQNMLGRSIQIIQLKAERIEILKILRLIYPDSIEQSIIINNLKTLKHINVDDTFTSNIAYLNQKTLVSIEEVEINKKKHKLLSLTVIGIDFLESFKNEDLSKELIALKPTCLPKTVDEPRLSTDEKLLIDNFRKILSIKRKYKAQKKVAKLANKNKRH
jgi:hypothetical protein